jgi:hypothetical protein
MFGRLERVHSSCVEALLPDEDEADGEAVTVRAADFPTYDALARRLVAVRHSGKVAILDIGH